MPVPDKYAHFVSVAKNSFNPAIEELLKTTEESQDIAALKEALLIQDDDSFNLVLGRLSLGLIGGGLLAKIITDNFYGVPKSDFKQSKVGLKEQVIFSFREPRNLQKERKAGLPKRLQIGVNVQGKNIDIAAIQGKIKTAFPPTKEKSKLYFCGTHKYSYYAPDDGLQITQLQSSNDSLAVGMVQKICNIFDIEYKPDRLKKSQAVIAGEKVMQVGYVGLFKVVYVRGKDNDLLVYRA